jgi:hypothetical protein
MFTKMSRCHIFSLVIYPHYVFVFVHLFVSSFLISIFHIFNRLASFQVHYFYYFHLTCFICQTRLGTLELQFSIPFSEESLFHTSFNQPIPNAFAFACIPFIPLKFQCCIIQFFYFLHFTFLCNSLLFFYWIFSVISFSRCIAGFSNKYPHFQYKSIYNYIFTCLLYVFTENYFAIHKF